MKSIPCTALSGGVHCLCEDMDHAGRVVVRTVVEEAGAKVSAALRDRLIVVCTTPSSRMTGSISTSAFRSRATSKRAVKLASGLELVSQ